MNLQKYLIISLISCFGYAFTQNNSIQRAIDNFMLDKMNRGASVSFMAMNAENGAVFAKLNENSLLTTASTAKLFSTASAFEILGKDFKSLTKIYIDGQVKDSILYGNIWIRGAGDVSLGSKFFNNNGEELNFLSAWADSIRKKGIHSIKGAIITDGSDFGYQGTPEGWSWGDIGNYYGAPAAGINFYDNQIKLLLRTGKAGTQANLLQIYPEIEGLKMRCEVNAATVSDDQSIVYGAPFSLDRYISGRLPQNRDSYEVRGSMPDPEYQLAYELTKVLKKHGIAVNLAPMGFRSFPFAINNRYDKNFQLLFEVESKTVNEIAYWTNLRSVNLFAEGLLNWLGYRDNLNGSTEHSLEVLQNFWKGKIDLTGASIKDGSGLSRNNAVSANHFCQLLKYMHGSPYFQDFKATLPIAGVSGTLKNLCRGQVGEGKVIAKSGTISRVKSYAGYVYSKSGKIIAFAFIVNNYDAPNSELLKRMESVLNAMAAY